MKKMIIIVLIFITLVMALSIFLVKLYNPVKTPYAFENSGFIFREDGSSEPCTVRLAGTMSTYHFNVKSPSFFNNPLSDKEGLIVNGRRYIDRLVIGWPEKEDNYVTFVFNGTRFITDRNFTFVLSFLPDRENNTSFIAVSPAASEQEAQDLIRSIFENQEIHDLCPGACESLKSYIN